MRLLKMFGVAAFAAIAAMALIGASSAMAETTLLCEKNTPTETPTEAECGPVHSIHSITVKLNAEKKYVLGKAQLESEAGTVECHLLVSGTTTQLLVENGPVAFTSEIAYTECNLGCSVTQQGGSGNPTGTILILKEGVELASVVGDSFAVTLNCPLFFKCDYSGAGLTGHGLAGPEGKAHVTYTAATVNLTQKLAGPLNCPSTTALTALLQSLTPLYIRK
jgi:hypothetical protein